MSRIEGIAIKRKPRGQIKLKRKIYISHDYGLSEDHRGAGGRKKKRQVTVLSNEQWEQTCKELNYPLPWIARRANLLVSGLSFSQEDVGKKLRIGESCVLEITGETAPCSRMDEAHKGLKEALAKGFRAGVTCRVVTGGIVALNSPVTIS